MTVSTIANSLTPEQWQMVGETCISALLLSPFMLGIKHWFSVHHELVMTLYVIGGSFVTSMLAYVQNTPNAAPWLIIPLQGLVTFALSQPVYYGLVKPARKHFTSAMAQAQLINEAKRSAAVPEGGIPAGTVN